MKSIFQHKNKPRLKSGKIDAPRVGVSSPRWLNGIPQQISLIIHGSFIREENASTRRHRRGKREPNCSPSIDSRRSSIGSLHRTTEKTAQYDDSLLSSPSESSHHKSHSSRHSESVNHAHAKHTRCFCIWIVVLSILALLSVSSYFLYRHLTRYSCNAFGVSIARSRCEKRASLLDQNELDGLQKCADTLRELMIKGSDWQSLHLSEHTFPKVRKLTVASDTLQSIQFGRNAFNALAMFTLSSPNLTAFSVLDNSFRSLPTLVIQGAAAAPTSLLAPSFAALRIGNNSLTRCDFSLSTKPFQLLELGVSAFHDSPRFVLGPFSLPFSFQKTARDRCISARSRCKPPIPFRFLFPPPATCRSIPRRSAR